ncbi:Sulfate Permease (SulP) Family [Phytophthora palmivora]|uniref:Sulfate Permease (SulP) Family n=1 Tax=Phytophthora palmivora TaxID=4796 RepID=A0A2P4YP98_9STRA|nr:Sulfate Permease (SulP) Family [Phytophthora palmivora]
MFGILCLTFHFMVLLMLELDIVVGIIIAGFNFIYSYIATSSVHRVMKRSRVERDLRERVLLQNMRMSIVTLELEGYIFFGSSVKVMDEVRRHVLVTTTEKQEAQTSSLSGSSPMLSTRRHAPSPYVARSLEDSFNDDLATLDSVFDKHEPHGYSSTPKAGKSGPAALHAARTRYFILDFEKVSGVDATAVRSCFNATKELLAQHGIALIFASVPTDAERLLRVHDVIEKEDGSGTGSLVFDTLDKALEWCEDELLVSEGVLPLSESAPTTSGNNEGQPWQLLDELLPRPDGSHRKTELNSLTDTSKPLGNEVSSAAVTRELGEMYVTHSLKQEGETLYRAGGLVNGVYFIGYGKVDVFMPSKIHEGLGPGFRGRKRITRVCQGGLVGASEMILHKRHQFTAQARSPSSIFFLSKSHYARMQKVHPTLAARFQQAMLQSMAIGVLESNLTDD